MYKILWDWRKMIESATEFVRLRLSEDPSEYNVAAHSEAPIQVWLEVIEKYPEMAEWVAHNKTVPDEILSILSKHENSRVRYMVASKNKLSISLMEKLSTDADETIRMSIARHKKATKELLNSMLNDDWAEIREIVKNRLNKGIYK